MNLPVIVVEEHMMVPAEKYSVGKIGETGVAFPLFDVVGFCP